MSFRHLPKFLLQGQSTPTDTPLSLTTAEVERSSYPIRTSATVDRGIDVSKSEGNFLREPKEFAPTESSYHSGAVPVGANSLGSRKKLPSLNFLREPKEFAPTESSYHSGAVPVA